MEESQLRELIEGPTQDYAIFSVDPEGYILTWNDGAMRMKQYTAEEAIGQHFSMLYPEEARQLDEPMEHLREAARTGRYRGEGIRRKKSGQHFLADVQITPIYKDEKLIGFSKVVADVTEQGKIRNERDEQIRELQAERGAREDYISNLSHDIRNPLTAIKSAQELIAKEPGLSKTGAKLVDISIKSLNRIDRMISDLLDANRIRAGARIPLKITETDLRKIVSEVCEEFKAIYGQRIEINVHESVLGFWDGSGIKRVVENLVSNAIKYGDPLEPVTIRLKASHGKVTLEVHNKGVVISPEDQKRLFERFHRSDTARASEKQGWGLGLTLVRGLVEAHGGTVSVSSSAQEGTTFVVNLPSNAWPLYRDQ